MIAIVNNNAVVINNSTSRRANVIAKRTNSDVMGVVKAQMIDVLKAKLQSGIAHFLFLKKDGSLREAWGTTANNLVKANVNGRGVSRDSVNCVCYWDIEKGDLYPPSFPLALLKQKRVPNFFGTLPAVRTGLVIVLWTLCLQRTLTLVTGRCVYKQKSLSV